MRLDLKLTKRQLSLKFHVDDTAIYLWEKDHVRPSLAQVPKIIEFVGHDPFEKEPESLGARIREYRRIHGLTHKKLAEQLGVDQTSLPGWERGKYEPSRRFLDRLSKLGISSANGINRPNFSLLDSFIYFQLLQPYILLLSGYPGHRILSPGFYPFYLKQATVDCRPFQQTQ